MVEIYLILYCIFAFSFRFYIFYIVSDTFRALDIVEVNPALGNKDELEHTLAVTALVIKTFLGYSRSGNAPLNVHEIPTE